MIRRLCQRILGWMLDLPANPYHPLAWVRGQPSIGPGTWIGPFCIIDGTGGLSIGSGVDIAAGAQILSHDTVGRCTGRRKTPKPRSTIISDKVFIGAGAIILPGCTIGFRSVIAAGAVVPAGSWIPPSSLVAGVPGQIKGTSE